MVSRLQATARKAGFSGDLMAFGSSATGFRSAQSDIDVAYVGDGARGKEAQAAELARLLGPLKEEGYEDVTRIFASSTPLLKFHDPYFKVEERQAGPL